MKLNLAPFLTFLALGLFGGYVWFTQNPESPWLERAESWPWVGELAHRFRLAYLGPEAAGEVVATLDMTTIKEATEGSSVRRQPGRPADRPRGAKIPLEVPAEPITLPAPKSVAKELPRSVDIHRPPRLPEPPAPTYVAEEWRWFLPGQPLSSGAGGGVVLGRLEILAHLPVLARSESWVQVMYRGERVWADTDWRPPAPDKSARRGLVRHRQQRVKASDTYRLKKARQILGIEKSDRKIGAYALLSDVEDSSLLSFLDEVATQTELAYFARYGRLPSGDPTRSVVLFASRGDYYRFAEESGGSGVGYAGHAGRGIAALFAGGQSREALAITLVHEITHLLNRRALASGLPLWLEEGLASDLGSAWFESKPAVAGEDFFFVERQIVGFDLSVLTLAQLLRANDLPAVTAFMDIDRETFHRPEIRAYSYAQSVALVRYLLDGEDGALADGFRLFLQRVATGREPRTRMLLNLIERDAEQLDQGFRAWLPEQRRRLEEQLGASLLR